MSRRPRSVREIYSDSISINLIGLRKDMIEHGAMDNEITSVLSLISDLYSKRLDEIEKECERDSMALESVPSPLELLVECMSKVELAQEISQESSRVIAKYLSAWEGWM